MDILSLIISLDAPLILFLLLIYFIFNRTWDIPVVVLRFVGDKSRPLLIIKKARKRIVNGVPKIQIRGIKNIFNDYKSTNYYPTPTGKHGGLILWEFEDGLLTPLLPYKTKRAINIDEEKINKIRDYIRERVGDLNNVQFLFEKELYEQLKLKAVDDIDIDGLVYELSRQNMQYSSGWARFLDKYGGFLGLLIVSIIMIVLVVMFFDKAPELAANCAQSAVENSKELIAKIAEGAIGTTPAG